MARSEKGMDSVAVQENLLGPMIFSSDVSDMSFSWSGGDKRYTCWSGCGAGS
jgi:hypothetical protein